MRPTQGERGVTIVELLVSVAIFSLVAMVSVTALINTMEINKGNQAFKTSFDNLTFALDSMSRNIRLGSSYYCSQAVDTQSYTAPSQPATSVGGVTQDCPSGGIHLSFLDFQVTNQVDVYQLHNGAIEELYRGPTGNASYIPITAPQINVTNLTFYVNGSTQCGFGPSVRMVVAGTVTVGDQTRSFNLENFLSQRPWNNVGCP